MLKTVALHGSARIGGDTDTLTEHVLRGLRESCRLEETHFRPIEMNIAHCKACMHCATGSNCIIDDDMQRVYPAFSAADVVVIATPMFWGYMTSPLKTLFDRLEALASPAHFGGKDFVLVIGYRHYYGSMIEWLERIAGGFGSRSHPLACRTYDPVTQRDIPVTQRDDWLHQAREIGRTIAALRSPPPVERNPVA